MSLENIHFAKGDENLFSSDNETTMQKFSLNKCASNTIFCNENLILIHPILEIASFSIRFNWHDSN